MTSPNTSNVGLSRTHAFNSKTRANRTDTMSRSRSETDLGQNAQSPSGKGLLKRISNFIKPKKSPREEKINPEVVNPETNTSTTSLNEFESLLNELASQTAPKAGGDPETSANVTGQSKFTEFIVPGQEG